MFGLGKRGAAKSVTEMQALLADLVAVENARTAFKSLRDYYLMLVKINGENDADTRKHLELAEGALQWVYACDAEAMKRMPAIEYHASVIDRWGSASDRELVTSVGKKAVALAADDGSIPKA